MSLDNARRFVERMREEKNFRSRVVKTSGMEDFNTLLQEESLAFNQRELAEAMAECMDQLESCACC